MNQPSEATPAQKNTLMGVLSYIGPLVIVPWIVAKDDPFVKFHIRQGLVLLVIEIVLWVLMRIFFWQLWAILPLFDLIDLVLLILSIVGIVNVVQGKENALPIVGSWGNSLPL